MLADDAMSHRTGAALLEVRGVSKAYGHLQALIDVSMHLHAGEIVALVGDNGAGKSTLVKMIAGAHRPDQGAILVSGEEVEFRTPLDAREQGIETVYQDLALAPDLSVWANLFLGREQYVRGPGRIVGWMNTRSMRQHARAELARLQIPIPDVDVPVDELSGGQRQAVAVARGIAWGRRLVMLDEPTASLGVEEQENVALLVRRLAEDQLAVLLVSHNLAQVFELAQRVVVLRRGRRVAVRPIEKTTREEIVGLITGAIDGDPPG
ncbi:MAG: simple sugar transport system ATP-binding protein [Gaiellales bacterium]|jgi:ABC-type sugar transport system ATPase subunit|nr:simple sugar transport system ATP-binding protein [Gaiellales bacterium]